MTTGRTRRIVSIRVNGDAARAGLKAARREINKETRATMIDVATRRVVPRAKSLAPGIVRDRVVARATSTSAYLTIKGGRKHMRIGGLFEFGGTIRTPIRPKRAGGVIHFRAGGRDVFVRHVSGPRRIPARPYLRPAVERERGAVLRELNRRLPSMIQRRVTSASSRTALTR